MSDLDEIERITGRWDEIRARGEALVPSEELDIGGGVALKLDEDGGGLLWHHPGCRTRAWMWLRYKPDSTTLVSSAQLAVTTVLGVREQPQ